MNKIKYVMKVDAQIDKIFDIAEKCRKNLPDQKIRNLEKRVLLLAKDAIKKRTEAISDPLFDDVRDKYYEHGLICSSLIESYMEEISLYE